MLLHVVGMVKRGGKDVVTVDIYKEIYEPLSKAAFKDGMPSKTYINLLLYNCLNKLEFLNKLAPYLSIDDFEGNRITLKDSKNRKLIDIYQRNGEFFCESDNTTNCIHTHYVWASPRTGRVSTADIGKVSRIPNTSGSIRNNVEYTLSNDPNEQLFIRKRKSSSSSS